MEKMLRYFIMLMVILTALTYLQTARSLQKRASQLPISGEEFCRHLPKDLEQKCFANFSGYRFDALAANFCASHTGHVDFVCLNEIRDAIFQANMVSLCAGFDSSYLRLCLMAMRNKQYSEGERQYCEREAGMVDRVFCLSQYGRPYG